MGHKILLHNPAIPPSGTLSCTSSGYGGFVNYTCTNGTFSSSGSFSTLLYSTCYNVSENNSITMTAPTGKVWYSVAFASYGNPSSCSIGACNSATSTSVVSAACVGRSTCTISANNTVFGDPCVGTGKSLNVKMTYY